MKRMSALSIKQPYAEQIMRGTKKIEYRNMQTHKRERVYIYASLRPGDARAWKELRLSPGDLPTGVLIGTVEIVNCTYKRGEYNWHLARPKRLKKKFRPKNHPQPAWFFPF